MNKHLLAKKLKNKKLTIATAESCTGGLVAKLLTDISGSSQYFKLGIIAYSNEAKQKLLKIPTSILKNKGAVSKETAQALAKNVKKLTNVNIGLGITGIAGPSGGSRTKPVGLVYIACNYRGKTLVKRFNFKGNRNQIRQKSANQALNLISELIAKS